MDRGLERTSQEYDSNYNFTHRHIGELQKEQFLCFDLVQDGKDLALSFQKKDGGPALRPLDEVIFAIRDESRYLLQKPADNVHMTVFATP